MHLDQNNIFQASGAVFSAMLIGPINGVGQANSLLLFWGSNHEIFDLEHPLPVREKLTKLLGSSNNIVVFYDAKPTIKLLLNLSIDVARPVCLKTLSKIVGDKNDIKGPMAKNQDEALALAKKCLLDLYRLLKEIDLLKQKAVARLECLVIRPFAAMERRGMPLLFDQWAAYIEKTKGELEAQKSDIYDALASTVPKDLFGQPEIDLSSDEQVKDALEKITGQTLANAGKNTLASLNHEVANLILRYRENNKLVSTYGYNFLSFGDKIQNRLYGLFDPLGTATGRASSSSPNLQNLPSQKSFHECIRPRAGRKIISADYASCELRVLAGLSGDQVFIDAFANDQDLHAQVACELFGVAVNKTQNAHLRKKAKAINFGIIYGMGVRSLAKSIDVSESEGAELLDKFFRRFPKIKGYLEGCVDQALSRGYCQSVLGRRLELTPEHASEKLERKNIARIAKNMPIQGSAADIIKVAMLRLHERLNDQFTNAGMINMVHDELVVECNSGDANAVAMALKEEMEYSQKLLIPNVEPKVDLQIGDTWKT